MGVRVTNKTNVAMYDSVTGFAFGPTFKSKKDANEFLDWYTGRFNDDPRSISGDELELHHAVWLSETGRNS